MSHCRVCGTICDRPSSDRLRGKGVPRGTQRTLRSAVSGLPVNRTEACSTGDQKPPAASWMLMRITDAHARYALVMRIPHAHDRQHTSPPPPAAVTTTAPEAKPDANARSRQPAPRERPKRPQDATCPMRPRRPQPACCSGMCARRGPDRRVALASVGNGAQLETWRQRNAKLRRPLPAQSPACWRPAPQYRNRPQSRIGITT